jgi:hypothetical protein
MLTNRPLKSRFLAYVAAGGMCLATTGNTLAADCGCKASCDVCPTATTGCSCDCSSGKKKHNCVYKALDAFAGGIEKLLRLDQCDSRCDESVCDDGCDAAMIDELMLPMPPTSNHHVKPFVPPAYSGPTQDVQVTPTGPSQWQGAGQPMIDQPLMESQDAGQHLGSGAIAEPEDTVVPPPVRVQELDMDIRRRPVPQGENTERGSLFDTLSDPFLDDQTRTRAYQPVRPSSYDDVELRPISKRPLSRSYSESSRRARSVR